MNRRGFLIGLGGIIVAPAIVRISSIMPISAPIPEDFLTLDTYSDYVLRPMVERLVKALESEIMLGIPLTGTRTLWDE